MAITAIIEGKSGKIYLSEEVKSMKVGVSRIVDIELEGKINEPYRRYFKDDKGNITTFDEYTAGLQPIDNEDKVWDEFYKRSTGNPFQIMHKIFVGYMLCIAE